MPDAPALAPDAVVSPLLPWLVVISAAALLFVALDVTVDVATDVEALFAGDLMAAVVAPMLVP